MGLGLHVRHLGIVQAGRDEQNAIGPIARDSSICQASTMKSLRSTGRAQAARACCKNSGAPWKNCRSVSTERQAAANAPSPCA